MSVDIDEQVSPTATGVCRTVLEVVVPVYNEERDLDPCIRTLHNHLLTAFPYRFHITIADNASVDDTPAVGSRLAAEFPEVSVVRLEQKGRGRALKAVWLASAAQVLAYCDVDLSTDLNAVLPLIAPLVSGHSDLAIGTRLSPGSRVVRGAQREVISRCYNFILRRTLAAGFSDAQCGFKAIRADVAHRLLPLVQDPDWFFDTELLVLAERAGLRIHEVPVDWVDDPDSRVDVVATAVADLKGVWRVGRALAIGALPIRELGTQIGRQQRQTPVPGGTTPTAVCGQLARFAVIGVVSTVAYLVLYLALRGSMAAPWANLLALLICAAANTSANRRITFGVRGRVRAARHQAQGMTVFALGLGLTSGALALLGMMAPGAGRGLEVAVLILANTVTTVLRFVLFRSWVFRSTTRPTTPIREPSPQTAA